LGVRSSTAWLKPDAAAKTEAKTTKTSFMLAIYFSGISKQVFVEPQLKELYDRLNKLAAVKLVFICI